MTRLVIPIALALIVANYSCSRFVQHVDTQKRQKVEELTTQIPIYASFQEVGKHELGKSNTILITKYFTSAEKYEVVKDYYTNLLTPQGWRLVEEHPTRDWGVDYGGRSLIFIRGEYLFSLEYEGKRNTQVGRDYSLNYGWESPEFRQRVSKLPLR